MEMSGAIRLSLLISLLAHLTGCAPAERLENPADWPERWAGRTLWSTPNAYIYASRDASAGEMDRMAANALREYAATVGGPTKRPLIIVRDAGEPLPGTGTKTLLKSALRTVARRDLDSPEDVEELEEKVKAALMALKMSTVVCGTALDALVGMMPLAIDPSCLGEVCEAPRELVGSVGGAVILPTRACLRENARRVVKDALKQFGIGPVAQVLFAPILAMAEARMVDHVARLRDAALFNYWLFEHADLAWAEKRKIASDYLERLGVAVESDAAEVAAAARGAAGGADK